VIPRSPVSQLRMLDVSFAPSDPYACERPVTMLKSIFEGRPATIFFQYPPQCGGLRRDEERTYPMKENKHKLRFKITDQVHTYNCVVNALAYAGFL